MIVTPEAGERFPASGPEHIADVLLRVLAALPRPMLDLVAAQAIDRMDATDAPGVDGELEPLEDADLGEASLQPGTLETWLMNTGCVIPVGPRRGARGREYSCVQQRR